MTDTIIEGELFGSKSTSLAELNNMAISKLYDLIRVMDEKTDPEMILACTKGIAQLNSSLKGSDILPQEESEAERAERLSAEAIKEAMNGN